MQPSRGMEITSLLTFKAYFIKTGHECGMNEKEHILRNMGQCEDGTLQTACKVNVWRCGNAKKNHKGT